MKKEDFRVRRTKRNIKEAFMLLMKVKPYNKITIKEITEKADVNRNTFYLHYLDKDDLLDKMMNDSFQKMTDRMKTDQATKTIDLNYDIFYVIVMNQFAAVEEDLEFFNLILGDDSIPYLQSKFVNVIKSHMSQGQKKEDMARSKVAYIEYLSSGLTGLIKFWLKNKSQYTIEEMTELVIDIYSNDVLEALGKMDKWLKRVIYLLRTSFKVDGSCVSGKVCEFINAN